MDRLDPLFLPVQIEKRIQHLALRITWADVRDLVLVVVMNGAFMFAADLLRALARAGCSPAVDFLTLSSYGAGTESAGTVHLVRDISIDVSGRDVVVVDDILDTGRTMLFARQLMATKGARSVLGAVLLQKPARRAVDVECELVCFKCPDEFVVGYGLDLAHRYRGLPYVGRLVRQEVAA